MEQATLLCHLETNGRNKAVLAATSDLATMLNASVIGIAACQPIQPFGEVPYSGEILEADIAEIQRETKAVEQHMRSQLGGTVRRLSFRSAATYQELADYIAGESRSADFIVTAPDIGGLLLGETRRTSIGDLVMDAGRPVIIVPPDTAECRLGHVVVAWKDSRSSRRAVSDALPLLRHAARVTVAEVTREADLENAIRRTDDVVAWLQVHGVQAGSIARISDGTDAESLHRLLDEENCDFVVAGAYGRSRVGEWIFGGVTTDLLLSPDRCTLVSH
jgi:nucleotide-binding universal stress UspA family protein